MYEFRVNKKTHTCVNKPLFFYLFKILTLVSQTVTLRVLVPLEQGHVQDLMKGGAHAHAQILDGCGLSYLHETD